jgi:hypothetical protein
MAEERLEETEEGYYVQHGDVREWRWKDSPPLVAAPVKTEAVTPKPKRKSTRKAKK